MSTTPRRSALVTGAASGIGLALATQLTNRRHDVTIADIDHAGIKPAAAEIGASRAAVPDVSDADATAALAAETGPVDLLCLNAGVLSTSTGPHWEADPDEWNRVLGVNLHGVIKLRPRHRPRRNAVLQRARHRPVRAAHPRLAKAGPRRPDPHNPSAAWAQG